MPENAATPGETPVSRMRACFEELGSNLAFIRQELPGLGMPEEERRRYLENCASFAEEVQSLRAEVVRLLGGSPLDSSAIDALRVCLRGQVDRVDEWVQAVRALEAAEPGCTVVRILIEESGANMLRAYMGLWEGLELG